ncbi:MAG TPA: penicillin-binding transpeptidase domain-containing protein, partial [Actinomycetota bacterium]|nr:penicillin-binding transpeptidase domain-containing protein [Actinomycetota bacterium]
MNRQIRIIGLIALVLFGVSFVNLNWVQLVNAQHLADNPANVRVILKEYAIARGPILSGDEKTVAASVKTPTEMLKYLRTYPEGPTYADVSGYYSYVYGRGQLEATYNKDLTGQGGGLTMQSLSDQLLGGTQQGNTVVTTINDQLQKAAAQALGTHRGAVVALDTTTGAILAMVSSPSYDPSTISSHDPNADAAAWKALQADPGKPMLNRATSQTYPPGSTFKVITAAAALENGLGVNTSYAPAGQFLPAQTNSPIKNFGNEVCGGNMTQALTQSCNVYFARLATQLPAGTLAKTARDFGFGEAPPLDIGDVASRLPTDADLKSPAFVAQSAIGQYNVAATPLQMALVAAGIANQGKIMVPRLVKEVRDPQGNVIRSIPPALWKTAVSPDVAATLTTLMEGVVDSGTGTAAQIPGVKVAGKTGTAQNATGQPPHAWFISFAPADAPKIAVAVLIENGGNL